MKTSNVTTNCHYKSDENKLHDVSFYLISLGVCCINVFEMLFSCSDVRCDFVVKFVIP